MYVLGMAAREVAESARERRTQADRSAATRAVLADAAVEVLIERGWSAVTVVEVCNRAGLTRGAFHHHYSSLPELLADALRRLYDEMRSTPRHEVVGLVDLVGLVDVIWAHVGKPRFKAVIEAWLAMANDPSLQPEIGPVVVEFAALVNPDRHGLDAEARDFVMTARETMIGLALGRATNGGKPLGHERRVLDRLRAEAAAIDARRAPPETERKAPS